MSVTQENVVVICSFRAAWYGFDRQSMETQRKLEQVWEELDSLSPESPLQMSPLSPLCTLSLSLSLSLFLSLTLSLSLSLSLLSLSLSLSLFFSLSLSPPLSLSLSLLSLSLSIPPRCPAHKRFEIRHASDLNSHRFK